MVNTLENLTWKPMWASHLGCIKGCLDYLSLDISDAWLSGGTGHAFVINIHVDVCPSGPTAWNTEMLGRLGRNLGYDLDCTFGMKREPGFASKQRQAWEFVKKAIDEGVPCYGWELEIPEFYVVFGYDGGDKGTAAGYFYSGPGCDEGKGPKPWQELGDTGIGIIEMYSARPREAAEDAKAVKDALTFALQHAQGPETWIFADYRAGLAGYDAWIHALERVQIDGFGMAYNAAVWSECRAFAVAFLREARERFGVQRSPLFDAALEPYNAVDEYLKQVAELFPFHGLQPEHIADPARRQQAIMHLQAARDAEASGLAALECIVDEL